MRTVLSRLFPLLFVVGLSLGCSCDDKKAKNEKAQEPSGPPPPLVAAPVPKDLKVQIHPQIGATAPRPLAIVLAAEASFCSTVRSEWKASGHVLCDAGPVEGSEERLKKAIGYLKSTYPRHIGSRPVHLFADRQRTDAGWHLMLKEPTFFSYGYLAGLNEKVLTHTTLSALHSRGARVLAAPIDNSKRLELLIKTAGRRGLLVAPLPREGDPLTAAIRLMKSKDARLLPPPPPAAPPKSP